MCPHDHVMQHMAGSDKNGLDRYRAPEGCAQCPLLNQCLTSKQQARSDSPCRDDDMDHIGFSVFHNSNTIYGVELVVDRHMRILDTNSNPPP